MNDKELLELAAKAAGIEWPQKISDFSRQYDGVRSWNPLTDDGDALRLAVNLGILNLDDALFNSDTSIDFHDSPHAATRRAIVRAAAELVTPPSWSQKRVSEMMANDDGRDLGAGSQ